MLLTDDFWPAVGADQEFFERVCRRRGDEVKIVGLFICLILKVECLAEKSPYLIYLSNSP